MGQAVTTIQDVSDNMLEISQATREQAAGFCTLITLDGTGHPQARIMDPFPAEADFTVWMATNSGTRKVAQLTSDERATLFFFDPEGLGYVTLLGTARIIRDPVEEARRWKDEWADFYEDGHRGPDFVLIRFEPDRLEVMSIEHEVASDPKGWKAGRGPAEIAAVALSPSATARPRVRCPAPPTSGGIVAYSRVRANWATLFWSGRHSRS